MKYFVCVGGGGGVGGGAVCVCVCVSLSLCLRLSLSFFPFFFFFLFFDFVAHNRYTTLAPLNLSRDSHYMFLPAFPAGQRVVPSFTLLFKLYLPVFT